MDVNINSRQFMVKNKSVLNADLLSGGRKMFDEKDIISKYTQEDALNDGILVIVGKVDNINIVFTTNLFGEGYEDYTKRNTLVKKGLELLEKPDKEDTSYMKLRVIEKGKIWVVYNAEGITFMKPEDY